MKIYTQDGCLEVGRKAAQLVVAQMICKQKSVLGLATGSTPIAMYEELAEMCEYGDLDFKDITTFNLDEYLGLDKDNEQSYAYFMNTHLFKYINIKKENIHIPSGITKDIKKTCEDYDKAILENGIDLQVLGIGTNGHIGFNEPSDHFEAGTHLVDLDKETIEANARFFESIDEVPRQAISMGIKNIMQAKKVVLIAYGENKIDAIKKMLFGEITPNLPASILQAHGDFTLVIDEEIGDAIKDLLA
ncbi:MAG: glucosamine-6-phosphate deaminase [Lachnospirales bacterium]